MSYRASIHDLTTGQFLFQCDVEAGDLHEAENAAISKAAVSVRGHPREMDVRHLHECPSRRNRTGADEHEGLLMLAANV